jgi:hypothetical protein
VRRFCKPFVSLLLLAGAIRAQNAAKKYVNQGEYQIYDAAAKDMAGNNFTKALADLDSWKKDYPDSDYRDDRQLLYVQAYAGAKQPDNAIRAAGELLTKDADAALGGPSSVVKLLFTAATAIQQVPAPTAEQIAVSSKAAHQLLNYGKKPEGLTDEAWAQARGQLDAAMKNALLYMALAPGTQAMQKNECAAAETVFTRALGDNPDSALAAWHLGTAELCLYKTIPDKASPAIYSFARAAAVDPVKGMVDPKWQQGTVGPYLQKVYEQYHGKDGEGLRQLRELAARTPFPPAGFKIQSMTEIAEEKQVKFEKTNPQLALWMKIKGALADTDGEQYFVSSVQGAGVPQLRGVLVEARPACHPKELLVAMPLPDAGQPLQPEITLKLDQPLTGKPDVNAEFQWEGVPSAFTKSPFMLTMETDAAKIEGLKMEPCAVAPAKMGKKKSQALRYE